MNNAKSEQSSDEDGQSQVTVQRPAYQIPQGIRNKKNTQLASGSLGAGKFISSNDNDFYTGHLKKDALLNQYGNDLPDPMLTRLGYE